MSQSFFRSFWNLILIFCLAYGLSLLLQKTQSRPKSRHDEISRPLKAVTPAPAELGADESATIDIFRAMSPSVVSIKNAAYHRDFFSFNVYEVPRGAGSGIVWDESGHIVTNFHVIYQADRIEAALSSDQFYEARVVGIAPDYDLAVLRIDAPEEMLHPIPLGSSHNLLVGQKVLALGNPFGLDRTLTTGIISALGRTIQSLTQHKIHDVIQTDAAINPGNSGGPLLDSFGRLIGINTAILSPSGTSAGIGFAIPSDTVNHIVTQLILKGKLSKAGLGISLIPDNFRESWGVSGAAILEVTHGSSAQKAGLQGTRKTLFGKILVGDIIVQVDDFPISNNEDLIRVFEKKYQVGDTVRIHYHREGKTKQTRAVLQEL